MLAVVHDLAEAQVGDITPYEGFTKEQKKKLEEVSRNILNSLIYLTMQHPKDAMVNLTSEMLHNSPAGDRIMNLWKVENSAN
jgi:putative hydrolase of HD superfamily